MATREEEEVTQLVVSFVGSPLALGRAVFIQYTKTMIPFAEEEGLSFSQTFSMVFVGNSKRNLPFS